MGAAELRDRLTIGGVTHLVRDHDDVGHAEFGRERDDVARRFHRAVVGLEDGDEPGDVPTGATAEVLEPRLHVDDHMSVALRARDHLTDRFILRADWALYTAFVSDQRSTEYRAVTAGVSFFF